MPVVFAAFRHILCICLNISTYQHNLLFCVVSSSRGFGFVTYKDTEMVDEAQRARPHRIDQRDVEVKRAMPKEVMKAPVVIGGNINVIGVNVYELLANTNFNQ